MAHEHFWNVIQENSLVFLLNNALVHMFPRIQNETLTKECIWVRITAVALAKMGAPKLSFHREGGQLPPFASLNLPLTMARSEKRQTSDSCLQFCTRKLTEIISNLFKL